MPIELDKETRTAAVQSIERFFEAEFEERMGNIRASALLNYVLEEIGPSIYNRAVADVQERLAMRVAEVDVECHEDEFTYWRKQGKAARR